MGARAAGTKPACWPAPGSGRIYPLLCLFGDEYASDLALGRRVMQAFLERFGERRWTLLVDRGFIDGNWIGALKERGVDVVIGVQKRHEPV